MKSPETLLQKLETATGEERLDVLHKICRFYERIDSEKLFQYASQAQELAAGLSSEKGLARSYESLCAHYFYVGDYSRSIEMAHQARIHYQNLNDLVSQSWIENRLGNVYLELGDYEEALNHYYTALESLNHQPHSTLRAYILNNIGLVNWRLKNYDLALEKYFESKQTLESENKVRDVANLCNNIGLIYEEKNDDEQALSYYFKALQLLKKDTDLNYKANVLSNIGALYNSRKQYRLALKYQRRALHLREKLNHKIGLVTSHMDLAQLYLQMEDYNRAFSSVSLALDLAQILGSKERLGKIYGIQARVYEGLAEFEHACESYRKHNQYKDEVFNEKSARQISLLQNRYEMQAKKREAQFLREKNEELHREIEERRAVEEALRASEDRLQAIFNNAAVMVAVVDREGHFLQVNPHGSEMLGYRPDEIQQMTLGDITHPDDIELSFQMLDRLVQREISQYSIEKRYVRRDGSIIWVSLSVSPLHGAEGELESVIAVIVDVTERQIALQALREGIHRLRELNSTKDKFFSIIAHDLRNPLMSLMLGTEELAARFDHYDPERMRNMIEELHASANRLYKLLENLLYWSRAQTGRIRYQPRKLQLWQIVQECFLIFKSGLENKNLDYKLQFPSNLTLYADPDMLMTIFRNLVSNAIKFSHPNGQITVIARKNEDMVEVEVRDQGVGIRPEQQDKLFRIEESDSTLGTKNEEGTGLGLILCKEFITKNGGEISVHSIWGKGTTIHVTLPHSKKASLKNKQTHSQLENEPGIPASSAETGPSDESHKRKVSSNELEALQQKISHLTALELQEKNRLVNHQKQQLSQALNELHQSQEQLLKLKKAIETVKVGVTITDVDGRIIFVNPADAEMHGYEVHELLGKHASIYAYPEVKKTTSPQTYLQAANWRREVLNRHKDGSSFPVQLTSVPFVNEDGTALGMITICEDITERKALQDTLKKRNAQLEAVNTNLRQMNSEKDEFLSIAAHDLRNPLSFIITSIQLMREDNRLQHMPDLDRYLESIEISAERMVGLISNLLDVNAIEAGKMNCNPQPVNFADAIQSVIMQNQSNAARKNITLLWEAPDKEAFALLDYDLIARVVDNLVSNAIKYSPTGKRVWLNLEIPDQPEECLLFSVRDEGPGLTEDDQGKLFKKFARLSARPTGGEHSTGLGLSIVKRLVFLMHGEVWAESAGQGQGSTFFVRVPRLNLEQYLDETP